MLNLNKNNFEIVLKQFSGFDGEITHKDDKSFHIFLTSIDKPEYEKYDIPFLAIQHPTDKNVSDFFKSICKDESPDIIAQLENHKKVICDYLVKYPIIYIDRKSLIKLEKHNKLIKCLLYHELGHYMYSDQEYDDTNENRESILLSGRISKKELDADSFAYSVCGLDYYDALVYNMNKCFDAISKEAESYKYLVPATELKLRVDSLVEKINEEKRLKDE